MATHVQVPGYCLHKARGTAYVRLSGKVHYLPGPYGSPQSRAEYDRLIAAWMSGGRIQAPDAALQPAPLRQAATVLSHPTTTQPMSTTQDYSVAEFIRDYLTYAKGRYPRDKYTVICLALRPLLQLFSETPLREFGPKRLKLVRDEFVKRDLLRREVNRRVNWIKKAISWAVSDERIGGDVPYRLAALEELKRGEQGVRESRDTQPVDEAIVEQTLAFCPPEVAAIARLQLLTAARSGELCQMRRCDLDISQDVWRFTPRSHKTQWRGQKRIIFIGQRAQAVLTPFLPSDPEAYVFSPARAELRRRQAVHDARTTPASCGNIPGSHRVGTPKREPGDRYLTTAYGQAIARACKQAFPLPEPLAKRIIVPLTGRKRKPRLETNQEWRARLTRQQQLEVQAWYQAHSWHGHQLRHTAGTRIRETFTPDAAQAVLGHKSIRATEIYAQVPLSKAAEVARQVG
ncbi:MAG: tyrosine-type recombinase/integrase [Phycisphaerae bacterium]